MLCKKPFMRTAVTSEAALVKGGADARLASTPLPCGQCLHCRINRSRQWATRLLIEQLFSEGSSFVTLTYDEDHLPEGGNLVAKDAVDWLKRYRYFAGEQRVRYYLSGEYGTRTGRPHYHVALFCKGASDEDRIKKSWKLGTYFIGDLNFNSARYIVKYIIKGQSKERLRDDKYLSGRNPEFARMSRKPGIGKKGVLKIAEVLKKKGEKYTIKYEDIRSIKIGGRMVPLPRYLRDAVLEYFGFGEDFKQDELLRYQNDLFDAFLLEDGCIYNHHQDFFEGKRIRQESLTKIYKQKRSLEK